MKRAWLLLLLIAVGAAALVLKRRGYSDREHERFQSALWRLRHLDATFNQDLLRARFSLLETYDPFHDYLREMTALTAGLHNPPRFVGAVGRAEIDRRATDFDTLLQNRGNLFEQFKSRNAILANSRRYFPVAVSGLDQRLSEAPADRELAAIIHELTRSLLAHAASAQEIPGTIRAQPDLLQAWAERNPAHAEAASVSSLVRHARELLVGKNELDGLTRDLLALPTAAGLDGLSHAYENELTVALRRTQQYRFMLYTVGALLMVAVGYALWAQRGANRRLEARVLDRTRELQAEVEERKRTQEALHVSERFLYSLMENMPVHVFRKDSAGRFTFANQLFCQRHGVTPATIIGRSARDFLPGPEAERQTRIDEQIQQTGKSYEATEEQILPDGKRSFIQLIKVPVYDSAGHCIGVQGMFLDVTARIRAEEQLAEAHRQLVDTSRAAGMAEVATGVLHNVGNVLNSVNVSATVVADIVRRSKAASLGKLHRLLIEHEADLAAFLMSDPKGRMVLPYFTTLVAETDREQQTIIAELTHLRKNIDHIKDVVAMQQNYAKTSGLIEVLPLVELVDDAIRMNASSLSRHDIELVRDYQARPTVPLDKHKVLQTLVNLIRNAKFACDESGRPDKRLTIRITADAREAAISVIDNGIGIPPENLTRIFNHGFTTKAEGHGFGLHSGANAAKEMGGSLHVASEGPGCGAAFTLTLPVALAERPSA